jgi:ABC-2 type transport system ATP-binding protein
MSASAAASAVPAAGGAAAIEAEALTKRYDGHVAIDRLSFSVQRGCITGFLGRNGAGKSTTLKMLLGMIAPSSGTARVLGHRIDDPRASVALRRRVAYVAEDKGLYAYMTVKELLRFTRSFYPDWRADYEARLLAQYQLPLDRKVKTLSKGMRTKLALLLGLSRQPELLILDEPSEGLDPVAMEQLLQELTARCSDGTTVFFSSHQLSDVERIADHFVIIDRGALALEASLDELRAHYRTITVGFAGDPPSGLTMPGVLSARARGRQVALLVNDNVDQVSQRARALGATSVQVASVSLREVFLDRVGAAP